MFSALWIRDAIKASPRRWNLMRKRLILRNTFGVYVNGRRRCG